MIVLLIALLTLISQIHAQIIEKKQCPDNSQWTGYCDVGCATCAQPDRYCVTPLIIRCSCLPDYVMNTADNNMCVDVNSDECRAQRSDTYVQLPPTCGPNEEFVYCGICDATCANPCICGRCVCLNGYLRDKYGKCIPENSLRCVVERPLNPLTVGPLTLSPFDPVTDIN